MAGLIWEEVESSIATEQSSYKKVHALVFRAKVPGGWLILVRESVSPSTTFYPDPNYEWS